ncbi:hypothetical protein [Actinotalea fermentans]|uniref:hypothetical protein n=1 Tax=Actinotalea fermentans TaxID=43671 RepID=UPI00051F203D|nr:hypothetical protein [Actinotalea fermentans]KGM16824.1 hypothetical protein N867_15430 [Actinotalea fermentans ATCC 43279 = JCM 9966 = DSM 3133]
MDVTAPLPGPAADPAVWRDTLSPELRTLTEITLAHALEAVVDTGSPMRPFAVTEDGTGRTLVRFDGEPGAATDRAREHARASAGPRAAVAWDGWLTVGGIRQDAVVVQASERGRPGVVVAHRYRDTLEGTVVVGKPVLVGPGDAVL